MLLVISYWLSVTLLPNISALHQSCTPLRIGEIILDNNENHPSEGLSYTDDTIPVIVQSEDSRIDAPYGMEPFVPTEDPK